MHGIALLLLTASAFAAADTPSASEAEIMRQIQQLQQHPNAAHRDWLKSMSQYQSQQTFALAELRNRVRVPRYPIAAAALTALHRLDVAERVTTLRTADPLPAFPTSTSTAVEIDAWAAWIKSADNPPLIHSPAALSHDWPEALLLAIAQKPNAAAAWRIKLIQKAQNGASLRWLDSQVQKVSPQELKVAESNPSTAEWAWQEWAQRANRKLGPANEYLWQAVSERPDANGLAAGLALWDETDNALQALILQAPGKSRSMASGLQTAQLQKLVRIRRSLSDEREQPSPQGEPQ